MPSPTAVLGWAYDVYLPDNDDRMDLGYTAIKVYYATTEGGSYSLAASVSLVAGQLDYAYNKTDGTVPVWVYHTLYGATPGETPGSEPILIGVPATTREAVRQGVGKLVGKVALCTVLASPSPSATAFASTNLIDADASTYRHANGWTRFTAGTYDGVSRRVRDAGSSGYTPASGLVTVNAYAAAPSAGDTFELWEPWGEQDPSVLIDEAMNDARHRLWYEETHYFTADSSVTEYYLPSVIENEAAIKVVEWAAGSYPNDPDWRPVGRFLARKVGGQLLLTVQGTGLQPSQYSGNTIFRVVYNRIPDAMDSDADAWPVNLEWAVAEVALEFLERPAVGISAEGLTEIDRMLPRLLRRLAMLRANYLPSVEPRAEVAV